jgi:hypothetical protein
MNTRAKEKALTVSQWITNIGAVVALLWVSYQLVNVRDIKAAGNQELKDRVVALEKFESLNNTDHSEIKGDIKDIKTDIKILLSRTK